MKEIAYVSPKSITEAIAALNGAKGTARVLAGGTDILVQLRENLRDSDVLVDVKRVPELTEIRQSQGGSLLVGAAVPCHKIEADPAVAARYPALHDAVHIIGGWQIKGRATLGGNLCTSSPAGDSLPALIALSATIHLAGPSGNRAVAAHEFCTGPGRNVLGPGELVVAFEFPPVPASTSSCYLRFIPRNEMDIAVVGCGVAITVSGNTISAARIGLGAVAPTPLYAEAASQFLVGKPATLASLEEAGNQARAIAKPITDMRAPADYRTHLVGVLVKRAGMIALKRIAGETVDPLKDKAY